MHQTLPRGVQRQADAPGAGKEEHRADNHHAAGRVVRLPKTDGQVLPDLGVVRAYAMPLHTAVKVAELRYGEAQIFWL